MARPLPLELTGGRFQVTFRGNERRPIFRHARHYQNLRELLAEGRK